MRGIGIDFGTTNSVIAVADDAGEVHAMRWPSASGLTDAFRTALAFRAGTVDGTRQTFSCAGPEAIAWALEPADNQRFIQSFKTHLASQAFRETRIFGRKFLLEDLIALFLGHLTEKGALPEGLAFDRSTHIAAGRPVIFAGDRADDALAVARLTTAYDKAGMQSSELVYEPLGAAYWYARNLQSPQTVLVADFGGGTSDFSLMQFDRQDGRLIAHSLAHDGVGIAGDTFDYRILDHVVAPRLGKHARYRSFEKWLPVPQHFFAAFSRWHQLSLLKGAKILADLEAITDAADEPEKLGDLRTIIDHDLGLELYAAVTETKARLSVESDADFRFDRAGVVLSTRITRRDFEAWISHDLSLINQAMQRTIVTAGLKDRDIDAVFMTGGTSYVPAVKRLFSERFGADRIHIGNAFQSVASGLALVARDRAMANALP
ncbi:MAG: Hsp70 family protein [Beijerinckiaceae bacterium]